jgi:hypothetical protein
MAMPKTSMYKNDFTSAGKDQVGVSGQTSYMKAIAETHLVNQSANR